MFFLIHLVHFYLHDSKVLFARHLAQQIFYLIPIIHQLKALLFLLFFQYYLMFFIKNSTSCLHCLKDEEYLIHSAFNLLISWFNQEFLYFKIKMAIYFDMMWYFKESIGPKIKTDFHLFLVDSFAMHLNLNDLKIHRFFYF